MSSGTSPGSAAELSETLYRITLQKLLAKPFGPFTWHIAIGNVPERARICAHTRRRSGLSLAASTTGIRPHQGQVAMARSFFELFSGWDASKNSALLAFLERPDPPSRLTRNDCPRSHWRGYAVVHNQKDGRRERGAARRRATQRTTKRMLSTTPVRGVMHQLVSKYS